MMTDENFVVGDEALDLDKAEDRYEDFNRRILLNPMVRKYMLAEGPHPDILLPWEEIREGLDGHEYYVDLVTDEIVWRQELEPGHRLTRLYDDPKKLGVPRDLWCYRPEEQAVYFKRREKYVHFWRVYLRIRENLLF